ncbi:MAG TPA: polysaccharide export protein [Gammaproteobacteria bacterium]|nr:polysaccharide export protein [Gammaproteobacteria bacterium]
MHVYPADRFKHFITVLLLLTASWTAHAEWIASELPAELSQLGPGDVIRVFVWKNPELSQDISVSPDGYISYPLIGEIQAAGVTVGSLRKAIEREFRKHLKDPQVTVSLREVRSYNIFVTGEVMSPGLFQPTGAVTVVQAIAMAGGFTAFASRNNIIVYNRFYRKSRLAFDYDGFIAGKSGADDFVLIPGDTIIVR